MQNQQAANKLKKLLSFIIFVPQLLVTLLYKNPSFHTIINRKGAPAQAPFLSFNFWGYRLAIKFCAAVVFRFGLTRQYRQAPASAWLLLHLSIHQQRKCASGFLHRNPGHKTNHAQLFLFLHRLPITFIVTQSRIPAFLSESNFLISALLLVQST